VSKGAKVWYTISLILALDLATHMFRHGGVHLDVTFWFVMSMANIAIQEKERRLAYVHSRGRRDNVHEHS
jgi:hypothetical protein